MRREKGIPGSKLNMSKSREAGKGLVWPKPGDKQGQKNQNGGSEKGSDLPEATQLVS